MWITMNSTVNSAPLHDDTLLDLILSVAPQEKNLPLLKGILFENFGDFRNILSADRNELIHIGIPIGIVNLLKALELSIEKLLWRDIEKQPILKSWENLIDYLHVSMSNKKQEHLRLLFLNQSNELIGDEIHQIGTINHTHAYPREIIRRTLNVGATALILVHNHPSGNHRPSKSDVEMTNIIIQAAHHCDIVVHDHIIISRSGYASLRREGLI